MQSEQQAPRNENAATGAAATFAQAPSISLPKGGGAIRGIGEKFAANPVTGTGSMSVPIFTSPGRSGFGPQLSLAYDSGAGNGPFGFGWHLSVPSITRKTDKGLPRYADATESDVFVLSGAEDLVPVLVPDEQNPGKWVSKACQHTINGTPYSVQRYRPRIEGLFARIERWTNRSTGEIHWRSISKENITTFYGLDNHSRIFDPAEMDPADPQNLDRAHPARIFSWLISESHDDKGNVIVYGYKAEDSAGVALERANERNRVRTANRYLKRIRYGNHTPYFPKLSATEAWPAPPGAQDLDGSPNWFFEVVFDYGEHDSVAPMPNDAGAWRPRNDPFSSYRSGFEVRTYRCCQRVLMFHHFADVQDVGANCLVRSTDFTYSFEANPDAARDPVYSYLVSATQTGYRRVGNGPQTKSLPPVEFEYTAADIDPTVHTVDGESLENLPAGLDGSAYEWVDLDGEGLSGILTEQAGAWFYKRNLSPLPVYNGTGAELPIQARFGPLEVVSPRPTLSIASGQARFMDLSGDGRPDVVQVSGPVPGFTERTEEAGWEPFRSFSSWPNINPNDPNLRFVDLDGDGHADILITQDSVFRWHPSLAEDGFGPEERTPQSWDEEAGPHLVFADGTDPVYLADLSGDGLSDLVRIRNGEVCYWPNLGYGRFGAKVTMDRSPWFDAPDLFDQRRIRLADIDGSGTTDIIYLHGDGPRLYFNQSGNAWSPPRELAGFPSVDPLAAIQVADLLGNGTACLVWSSPAPGDAGRQMRYVDLLGGQKPHLLVRTTNNLGAETRVEYAPSTRFYLQDKQNGRPWITKLPFPVHVVERVLTYDYISRNRFVTRYAYHHGYFDGPEREFRGFGCVEQWDTEQFATLAADDTMPPDANTDSASHVPPVRTVTWFHTGAFLDQAGISRQMALDYFGAPSRNDPDFANLWAVFAAGLLPDTQLPTDALRPDGSRDRTLSLTADELREAVRALKGSILRQEVYAEDGSTRAPLPYSVSERNYTIECLQPRGAANRFAVFFAHPRETLDFHHERNPADPRVSHALTLQVDGYGNALKSVAVGYGRASSDLAQPPDRARQMTTLITATEADFTNPIDDPVQSLDTGSDPAVHLDEYRAPQPWQTRGFELTGYPASGPAGRFGLADFVQEDAEGGMTAIFDSELDYEVLPSAGRQRRLLECARTLYRPDDLGESAGDPKALLAGGTLQPLALPGLTCKLAFTSGLLAQVYQRNGQPLLPTPPAGVLGGGGAGQGGYVDLEGNGRWWAPSGRIFYTRVLAAPPAAELAEAQAHFFLPRRFEDPFGQPTAVDYDRDLLLAGTEDAVQNQVSALNDWRVLQPREIIDPNQNHVEVVFDALGMVAGTALKGKVTPAGGSESGDSLDGFVADLSQAQIDAFFAGPRQADPNGACSVPSAVSLALLGPATTRVVYDLEVFRTTRQQNPDDPTKWQPVFAATLARETHVAKLPPGQTTPIQINFSYSDGFGREVQKKAQAEPGPVAPGGPAANPRWVGSGWTIFNNKGKPVRQYEPFFSALANVGHQFEFARLAGVSPVLFYDPVDRVVATLHPNHSYEKVVFDPWQQVTYDVNDTVAADPRTDPDLAGLVAAYFATQPADWKTWLQQRLADPAHPPPDTRGGNPEQDAAVRTLPHANTPTTAHVDALGRPFLTMAHNGLTPVSPVQPLLFSTRVLLDLQGNQRAVRDAVVQNGDAQGRVVMTCDYDLLKNRIHQASMEAGERWVLNDAAGKPLCAWDSRGHARRTEYDALRRPVRQFVQGADPAQSDPRTLGGEVVHEQIVYGEGQPNDAALNLRTRVFQQFDTAGVVTNLDLSPAGQQEAYDFKGNLLRGTRTVAADYQKLYNWAADTVQPAWETHSSSTQYDALNRPASITTPDQTETCHSFNEAGLLERVDLRLRGAGGWTHFVTNIDYDAHARRTLIQYGNGASTTYEYDPQTFRLAHLRTTRPPGLNGLSAQLFADPAVVQDLNYTYDPTGNITQIADLAVATVFNNQQKVDPVACFTYDPLYRLTRATGREHIAQSGFQFSPADHGYRDYPFVGLAHPNDAQALRNYTEQYEYDPVGNFNRMVHAANGGGWTRAYQYLESSLTEPGKTSNRLTSTSIGSAPTSGEHYTHDAHGNMTSMPHLPTMVWDFKDQLQATQQQVVNSGAGEKTWYVYGSAGQRVRKVTETPAQTQKNERLYLGGFELYRGYSGTDAGLVRETVQVMDDKQRIALVETRTDLPASPPLARYQFGNHLGSASLELDGQAQILSYEEYTPYGTTSFQAASPALSAAAKRYRYTAKERDEESGLYYHGARYYAAWLGRWTSCDPIGVRNNAVNAFAFVAGNPVIRVDPDGKEDEKPPRFDPKSIDPSRLDPEKLMKELNETPMESLDIKVVPLSGPSGHSPGTQSFEEKNIVKTRGRFFIYQKSTGTGYESSTRVEGTPGITTLSRNPRTGKLEVFAGEDLSSSQVEAAAKVYQGQLKAKIQKAQGAGVKPMAGEPGPVQNQLADPVVPAAPTASTTTPAIPGATVADADSAASTTASASLPTAAAADADPAMAFSREGVGGLYSRPSGIATGVARALAPVAPALWAIQLMENSPHVQHETPDMDFAAVVFHHLGLDITSSEPTWADFPGVETRTNALGNREYVWKGKPFWK